MSQFGMPWSDVWVTVVTAVCVYVLVVALSRVFGQRQFSRLTAYDLPFVFALGSLVGRVILVRTTLAGAVVGIATMFVLHAGSAWLHHHVPFVHRMTENRPVLLVSGGEILHDNVRLAGTSELEIHEKLRLAGVGSVDDVEAAIIERTGDISIVRAGQHLDPAMFDDVFGGDLLDRSVVG